MRWVALEERTRKGRAIITPDDCDTPAPLEGSPNSVPPKCALVKMNTQVPDAEAAKEIQLLATARRPPSGSPNFILHPRGLCQSHPKGSARLGAAGRGISPGGEWLTVGPEGTSHPFDLLLLPRHRRGPRHG